MREETGTMTDVEGNLYQTLRIGNQVWTTENLRTTKCKDGTAIPLVSDNTEWRNLVSPGYCWQGNDENSSSGYGALYNWYAVDTKNLAPRGWHVPTKDEWDTLERYLVVNGYNWDGSTAENKIAKSLAAKTGWAASASLGTIGNDPTRNNGSGFSALPGGARSDRFGFLSVGHSGYWWSATGFDGPDSRSRDLRHDNVKFLGTVRSKSDGLSVRLLRD